MDHHSPIFYLLAGIPTVVDTQATTILVLLLVILIVLSFCISGAQVAFFSLTYKEINLLKTKQQAGYKRIVNLLQQPKSLLASLVIGNVFLNLAIVIITNIVIDDLMFTSQLWWMQFLLKVLVVTFILVLFCEVMPKVMATQNNVRFAKDVGPLVAATAFLFEGLGKRFVATSDYIEKKLSKKHSGSYNLQDLDSTIDPKADNATLEKEKNILKGIVKFSNITVRQIMRSRLDVSGIEHATPFDVLVKKVEELHYSRLPVFKEDLDEVVGMLNTKDLLPYLEQPATFDWHVLMRPPYFVHEQKMIDDLLKEFQTKRIHFAVVVDEFGGTSGIVTLEDIMEEIIGEINDEFDEVDAPYVKLDDNTYVFEGKMMISEVCNIMELSEDTFDSVKGDSETLAGLVLEIAGEIPRKDEVITAGDFDFTVMEIEKNRLQKIKINVQARSGG